MSSKLSTIRDALEKRTDIVTVHVRETAGVPDPMYYYGTLGHRDYREAVRFYLAPARPVSSIERLNEVLISLVPDLEPLMKDLFEKAGQRSEYGVIQFEEQIGTVVESGQRVITLDYPDVFGAEDFVDGKLVIPLDSETVVVRRIQLFLYLSESAAHCVLDSDLEELREVGAA